MRYISEREGIELPENCMVYSQIKRLHEYKRQLMTAFAILRIYFDLKEGKLPDFQPSVFLFGAKAASCYFRAKGIIKYINEIARMVNSDAETNVKLRVVFVQNYNVSYAEKIVAGSDASLQVSTAGLEASGTGNMKFMMNGAVTVGTMDGANIEIVEKAGRENNYIFGATVEELAKIRETYDPNGILKDNAAVRRAVQTLTDGTFDDGEHGYFAELYRSLTEGAAWHRPDNYFVLYDLEAYVGALLRANADYADRERFAQKALFNATHSAYFSSDRTIAEYAREIWKVEGRSAAGSCCPCFRCPGSTASAVSARKRTVSSIFSRIRGRTIGRSCRSIPPRTAIRPTNRPPRSRGIRISSIWIFCAATGC